MNSVFVLTVLSVMEYSKAISSFAYQPQYSWCEAETLRRIYYRSRWVPNCDFWGIKYKPEQCDKNGNCWCVDESSGRAVYSYGFHRRGEVNCKWSQYCIGNQLYLNCGSCTRTCYQRNLFCPAVCRQGCFCPYHYFLLRGRCVPARQCPPIVIPRTASRTTTTPKQKVTTTPKILPETSSTVVTEIDIDHEGSASGSEKIETTTPTTFTSTIESGANECPENQVFHECAGCSYRCVDRSDPPECVVNDCKARCTCPNGLYLDGERCVSAEECPPTDRRCNDTMVYSTCGGCVKTCDQRHKAIACTLDCKIGCTCPSDTYLHEGKCVTEDQCPPSCPENQIFSYCGGCEKTCAKRNEFDVCPLVCVVGCTCPRGMFLDGERCVTADDCP